MPQRMGRPFSLVRRSGMVTAAHRRVFAPTAVARHVEEHHHTCRTASPGRGRVPELVARLRQALLR